MKDTERAEHLMSTAHDKCVAAVREHCNNPDIAAAIEHQPAFNCTESVLLDLAYEEYCIRRERGESIPKSIFAGRFPHIRHSLVRRIEVHAVSYTHLTLPTICSV